MKKTIALLLALLLVGGGALAEAFALENGAQWGMTQGDVLALEGTSDIEYATVGNAVMLDVEDTGFRGVEADLNYAFINDSLVMALYELEPEDADPLALIAALDGEYGAHENDDGKLYYDAMSALTGILYDAQPGITGVGARWTLPDGTLAMVLTGLEAGEDDYAVVYMNPENLFASAEASLSEPAPALDD